MMVYNFGRLLLIIFALSLSSVSIATADSGGKGFAISPLRREMTVAAGRGIQSYFMVTNLTDDSIVVNLSVKQFSVSDYTYDFEFKKPEYDWLKLRSDSVMIKAHEQQKIWYDLKVPDRSAPGGYYFSMFASTNIGLQGASQAVQAASLLYLKVDGKFIQTSVMQNSSIPFVVTDSKAPYSFDVKNTGNVHFSAYFFGQLEGIFGKTQEAGTSHLLMPGITRAITGSITMPLLPGIYKATYGYRVDYAQVVISRSSYIIYIPPWSVVLIILIGTIARWLWQKRKVKQRQAAGS